jgi:PIN domain nuclease of toxin-antitoxin system
MQLKHQTGRLKLDLPVGQLIREQQDRRRLQLLSIDLPHVLELGELPPHHADPFDRLLIAQARVEDAHLVTVDTDIKKYTVKILW